MYSFYIITFKYLFDVYWNNRNFFLKLETYEKFKLNTDLKDLERLSRVWVTLNLNKDLAIYLCILKTRGISNIGNMKKMYYDLTY